MSAEQRKAAPNISEIIAENFGANATYVETLLARWRSDPSLVDESWRSYFEEMVGANGDARPETRPTASTQPAGGDGAGAKQAPVRTEVRPAPAPEAPSIDAVPIRGPALKIVENMEASLHVPTATSQRRIPVKLLDENRRLINRHLEEQGRRKASYTHLIAYALLRAL